ncbi:hypothetical protein ACJMK2_032666 [Sinanodonta woodiana]|uniref:Mab-21-like HhH/H2TH-like domain-containing protein n=1 Tax=Sinanodonta woodiana TaxID=1069815 RepID=A0ABD3X4M4_SINWO
MANADRLSILISAMLDSMGFSRDMIDFRISNTRHMDIQGALDNNVMGKILTGGKAEGTSDDEQGDTDIMYVWKNITVSSRHIEPPSPQHTMLYTEDRDVHHGYTWLRVGHYGEMDNHVRQAMILTEEPHSGLIVYLSSSAFIQNLQQGMKESFLNMQLDEISGPSQPLILKGNQFDNVNAFPHPDWPVQASQWMDRCVTNGWPPEIIVKAIVQSGCHIVPKGFIGSLSAQMEWCFSFVVHEKSILQLFNMAQKHFYILLKIMAKDLKKRFPDLEDVLTSYTMKNVALWQVELHHTKDWDRLHMLDRIMEALYFLKSCVESEKLPAYFIPENNLFDGKLTPYTAALLSGRLNNLLSQGAKCILAFPSIQEQLQIMNIPGLRLYLYKSGLEMRKLVGLCCRAYLYLDISMQQIIHVQLLLNSPDMTRHRLLTKGISKIMKATFAYVMIDKIMNTKMSNRCKYEFCRPLLVIASRNSNTDRMAEIIKFAGILHVLGKANQAIETLYSIKLPPLFYICTKWHYRINISKMARITKKDSNNLHTTIARLGRDNYVQRCISFDVRYTEEEMGIVPNVIKYEFFHVPETDLISSSAYVDPDMLRYYLLYKCHTELGDEENAQGAFTNLIRISTQESFDPYMEYREVALNVLGLCYLEKKDYLRSYSCFCRAMSLRPKLMVEKWSTSTPWHLAVLACKLINR